jgi:hypothetical protein
MIRAGVTEPAVNQPPGAWRFTGSFENGNPRRITGTATCSYTLDGTTYHFAGQWQADH